MLNSADNGNGSNNGNGPCKKPYKNKVRQKATGTAVHGPTPEYSHVKFERIFVTPEMAAKWLGKEINAKNRKKRNDHIKRMAKDIKEGRWVFTHQGVAFDTDGILIDGQHRLEAIVCCGIGISLLVTTGLDPLARQYVDAGQMSRKTIDIMTLGYGMDMTGCVDQIAASIWLWSGSNSYKRRSRGEEITFYRANRAALDWVGEQFGGRVPYVGKSPVRGAIAKAYQNFGAAKQARLALFVQILIGNKNTSKENRASTQLREALLGNDFCSSNWRGSREVYELTASAILAFMSGVPLDTRKPSDRLAANED